jgi:cytochrome c-type biogenesis protein CcmH
MTVFWLAAVTLTLLALALVLPPLLRPAAARNSAAPPPRQASLAILRGQLAQLDAERDAGALDAAQHEAARADLERRVLEEAGDEPVAAAAGSGASRQTAAAILVGLALPCLALGLYWKLGQPQALLEAHGTLAEAAGGAEPEVTQAQIEAMVATMAERLENPPPGQKPDPVAWTILARAHASMERFEAADRAYARAIELAPADAQLLADRADVLAMLQGRNAAGEPTRLIEKALRLDPKNLKALALAGSAAFERKDLAAATRYWEQARALAPADSEFAAGLDRSLATARAGGDATSTAKSSQVTAVAQTPVATSSKTPAAGANQSPAAGAGGRISGTVNLAPALAAKVAPGDTVYIFARAAQGGRMPLAIVRRQAGELPIRFTLDDSMAMTPEMRLSGQKQVVLGARVSKSGQALPQSGDLVGQLGSVAVGAVGVTLTIDSVQP